MEVQAFFLSTLWDSSESDPIDPSDGSAILDETNIERDPLFVNADVGDFCLLSHSPAIDAGTGENTPAVDFDGQVRPLDGNSDSTPVTDTGAHGFGG